MKPRLNPWIVALTAVLTFGGLTSAVGSRYPGHWSRYHHESFCKDRFPDHPVSPAETPKP